MDDKDLVDIPENIFKVNFDEFDERIRWQKISSHFFIIATLLTILMIILQIKYYL